MFDFLGLGGGPGQGGNAGPGNAGPSFAPAGPNRWEMLGQSLTGMGQSMGQSGTLGGGFDPQAQMQQARQKMMWEAFAKQLKGATTGSPRGATPVQPGYAPPLGTLY